MTELGAVVQMANDEYVMTCFDCLDDDDVISADVDDSGPLGDDVPYPECGRCGKVMRGDAE